MLRRLSLIFLRRLLEECLRRLRCGPIERDRLSVVRWVSLCVCLSASSLKTHYDGDGTLGPRLLAPQPLKIASNSSVAIFLLRRRRRPIVLDAIYAR